MAEPALESCVFCGLAVGDVNRSGLDMELEDADCSVFIRGEVGSDSGEGNSRGDVGVPKFDGRDILESEWTIEFVFISGLSDDSGVHRTVGKDILNEVLSPVVVSGESFISEREIVDLNFNCQISKRKVNYVNGKRSVFINTAINSHAICL